MRAGLNAGAAIAKGKYLMKVDAHCMFSEGFDLVLQADCEDNWVCVPTRRRLDAENWVVDDGNRSPINYLYLDHSNDGINVKEWRQKNQDRSLDSILIDDILTCQGSCFFLPRDYWFELELFDEENYGPFRKDPQELTFKAWCSGGRVVRNKKCWYAHLHKGKRYGRGYSISRSGWAKGDEYVKKWWTDSAWDKQTLSFQWLLKKFKDMPGWEDHVWEQEEVKKLPNLYQYLEIDGKPFSRPR
jgi:glycosyltransferase involved in cell wall biosynthesis